MVAYTCQVCGSEFEHHFKKKTCSEGCANESRSKTVAQQWEDEEHRKKRVEKVREAMNRVEVREHMRRTQLGDQNSMAGRTGPSNPAFRQYAKFFTDDQGYERWRAQESLYFHVHRLLAVSEFGSDATAGMHVHHKNGIPWDNRPENIELMTPTEHRKLHAAED